MNIRSRGRFTRVDVAALLAFAAVWIYAIFMVRNGFLFADEGSYFSYAERFVHGDRPLVDEWHVAQFSGLLLCVPYRIFVALTGGTDGIILFMRYLFLAFNGFCYWFMYVRLRAYGWRDLIATLLFCSYIPYGIVTCSYYTLSIRLLMLVCLILFSEKQKPWGLFAAGALFACAVIALPGFVFLYFFYSALVLLRFIRAKRSKRFLDDFAFCLHARAWRFITLGAIPVAAVFLWRLFWNSDLQSILAAVPGIFSNPEYNYASIASPKGYLLRRFVKIFQFYGFAVVIPALAVILLSVAYACGAFRTRRDLIRKLLFAAACTLWLCSCMPAFRISEPTTPDVFFFAYPSPLFWFGFVCYLLGSRKNKRFFFFWIVGLLSSVCYDFLSDVVLSFGTPIAYIAVIVFLADLVRDLRAGHAAEKSADLRAQRSQVRAKKLEPIVLWASRLVCVGLAVWFGFITIVLDNASFPEHFLFGTSLFSAPYLCEKGPLRSIRCTQTVGDDYGKKLADIDTAKAKKPKNIYICGLCPVLYLYTDLPYATYSTFAWRSTQDLSRNVRYWTLHPERRPACIYIPVDEIYNTSTDFSSSSTSYDQWMRETFDPLCEYTVEEGQGGYILYVSRWKTDAPETE